MSGEQIFFFSSTARRLKQVKKPSLGVFCHLSSKKHTKKKHSDDGHGDMLSVARVHFRKQTHAARLALVTR
jgi:hypothetical protein